LNNQKNENIGKKVTLNKFVNMDPKIIVMIHQIFIILFYLPISFIVNKNAFYMAFLMILNFSQIT
jgi:hypothetical protein